jgi:hypothetical protein
MSEEKVELTEETYRFLLHESSRLEVELSEAQLALFPYRVGILCCIVLLIGLTVFAVLNAGDHRTLYAEGGGAMIVCGDQDAAIAEKMKSNDSRYFQAESELGDCKEELKKTRDKMEDRIYCTENCAERVTGIVGTDYWLMSKCWRDRCRQVEETEK